jgi:hypothetical protein
MSALQALQKAYAAGLRVTIDGEDLLLEGAAPPPAVVIELLSRNKTGVVAMLRPGSDGWSVQDWHVFFEERAAIAEFDRSLTRQQAEQHALTCCIAEWLNRHPVNSEPGRCLWCGGAHHEHDPLLPYGIDKTGHAWLHSWCWRPWHEDRKTAAITMLAAMGIPPAPRSDSNIDSPKPIATPGGAAKF